MAYTKTNWVNGTTPLNDKNMNKIENALENLDTNISKSTDEYSSTSTYSIGELVIYNNKLYKANQDITTAEAFNSSHWTEVTLLSDVNEIKSVVNNNAENLNKMDAEIANAVNFVHIMDNSKTFSFSIGTSTGGYHTYIIYGGWEEHFMYLLTTHPNPENKVIGYNQIFNNTGEANITQVTISNNIITITFSSTIWGGIQIIGEQAQRT